VHCMRHNCGLIAITASYVRWTSSVERPPVLTITGLPNAATWQISGRFVRSPDAIL